MTACAPQDVSADMLIRLASVDTKSCGRSGGTCRLGHQHQSAQKGGSAPEAAIEPKQVLVQVSLKVLRFDPAVTRTLQPSLQVGEDSVDVRQDGLGGAALALHDASMIVARSSQSTIAIPAVGVHDRARLDLGLDEPGERAGRGVRSGCE